jgi:hypothetical protein
MSLTKNSNNYLPKLLKVALLVGTNAATAVLLIGVNKRHKLCWTDVAAWGTFGVIMGAHFGVTNKPWLGLT